MKVNKPLEKQPSAVKETRFSKWMTAFFSLFNHTMYAK